MTTTTRIEMRGIRGLWRLVGIGVAVLCGVPSQASAQATSVEAAAAREAVLARASAVDYVSAVSDRFAVWGAQEQSVPQDVRIMRTIVRTALSEVDAPELPAELRDDSAATGAGQRRGLAVGLGGRAVTWGGGGDVGGFYMQGYGYLFTVHWSVSSLSSIRNLEAGIVMMTGRERGTGDEASDARTEAARTWADQYRARLSDALRDVIAGYGSTLHRAQPGESITFIADFGGGDDQMVTMTTKVDALQGSNVEANRSAIQVSTGQSGTSDRLRTQLKIMSQIIDASLSSRSSDREVYVLSTTYFGGSADPQYVPGYGVIFRKNARMSTSRTFSEVRGDARATVDSLRTKGLETYQAHLDTLRQKTVELLADYGPTLTELGDDDWVGLYYDVGSAAALISSGLGDYLVQARMRDIRQAATQSDPAQWLMSRLVTNEKEE